MKRESLLTLTLLLTLNAWGQKSVGRFSRTDNSSCYLVLNADNTFKYRFHRDLQWDLACGRYELRGDSIFFQYQSDMFDRQCNSEGINYTDTSGVILRDAIDKRFRPISARLSKNKITTNKIGDIADQETIGKGIYYYRRRKS